MTGEKILTDLPPGFYFGKYKVIKNVHNDRLLAHFIPL